MPQSVWPDLTKFCHFGNISKVFGYIFRVDWYLVTFWIYFGNFFDKYWPNVHGCKGKVLKNDRSCQLVTLATVPKLFVSYLLHCHWHKILDNNRLQCLWLQLKISKLETFVVVVICDPSSADFFPSCHSNPGLLLTHPHSTSTWQTTISTQTRKSLSWVWV